MYCSKCRCFMNEVTINKYVCPVCGEIVGEVVSDAPSSYTTQLIQSTREKVIIEVLAKLLEKGYKMDDPLYEEIRKLRYK